MNAKEFFELFKLAFKKWGQDKAGRLAAALSYYTIFSLAPLLVIAIAIAGFVFGEAAVQGRLVNEIEGVVGLEVAQMIETMVANTRETGGGVIVTIVSFALLLFGASNLFIQLQEALNIVWNIQPRPDIGISGTIRMRLGAFILVLGVVLLLVGSLVATTLLAGLGNLVADLFPGANIVFLILNWVLSFAIITALFALIFKVLPDVELEWREVLPGAAVTALLFVIGKELIGFYLGQAAVGSAFGAAGSLVVLLLWIFYSAQIFLFGAEFTYLYVKRHGTEIVPSKNAILLTENVRIQQGLPRRETIEAAMAAEEGPRIAPGVRENRSRSRYLQEENHPGLLNKPQSPAQKSMAALAGISLALIGFVSTTFIRSRR